MRWRALRLWAREQLTLDPRSSVLMRRYRPRLEVLESRDLPSFGSATNFPTNSGPVAVVVGDYNRDGKPDLAVAISGSNSVSILLGNGVGGFSTPTSNTIGAQPNSLVSGDFNNDSKIDL